MFLLTSTFNPTCLCGIVLKASCCVSLCDDDSAELCSSAFSSEREEAEPASLSAKEESSSGVGVAGGGAAPSDASPSSTASPSCPPGGRCLRQKAKLCLHRIQNQRSRKTCSSVRGLGFLFDASFLHFLYCSVKKNKTRVFYVKACPLNLGHTEDGELPVIGQRVTLKWTCCGVERL